LPKIRIVLVELTGIMLDIVRNTLWDRQEMAVVAEFPSRAGLADAMSHLDANFVIWHLEHTDVPDACPELFVDHPRIKVLALEDDGRQGFLWELHPRRTAIGEMSPSLLLRTIRRSVAG
jgi:DNA-binding NarL/FixJ family response regulator